MDGGRKRCPDPFDLGPQGCEVQESQGLRRNASGCLACEYKGTRDLPVQKSMTNQHVVVVVVVPTAKHLRQSNAGGGIATEEAGRNGSGRRASKLHDEYSDESLIVEEREIARNGRVNDSCQGMATDRDVGVSGLVELDPLGFT